MKRTGLAVLALLALTTVAVAQSGPEGPAILSGEAECHVWVEVVASVAVAPVDASVDAGQVTGASPFPITCSFRVDANTQEVTIYIIATNLYKADHSEADMSINVDSSVPAEVDPAVGNELNASGESADNLLAWASSGVPYPVPAGDPDMDASQTEMGYFQSGQSGHFSQDVDVTVMYTAKYSGGPGEELTKGQYSGFVKLVTMIEP